MTGQGTQSRSVPRASRALRWLLALILTLIASEVGAVTDTYTASGTWTAPAGVSSVVVEVWGGGGAGGGNPNSRNGGGGGGGGGYSSATVAVTPGSNYSVLVGAGGTGVVGGNGNSGGQSYFGSASTVQANGGAGGGRATNNGGAGGAGGALGAGTTRYSGGNGGEGLRNRAGEGGPGGSSAGTGANGTSASTPWTTRTAAAPPSGGGIGGNGGYDSDGYAPASGYGGGGGGSGDTSGGGGSRAGGNGAGGLVTITYSTAAAVSSIAASGTNPTNASSVSWTVSFNTSVTGVSTSNFSLVNSGLSGSPAITSVAGSGTTWTVTASTGTGSGTLGLNMTSASGVAPSPTNLPFTGQTYTLDRTPPAVASITRVDPTPTSLASVSWTVTFSENVTGVAASDFALVQAGGVSGAAITGVSAVSASVYTVTASTGSGNGSLGLNLVDNDSIADTAGNPLGGAGAGNGNFTGEVYSIARPVSVTGSPTGCVDDSSIGSQPWSNLTGPFASDNVYATASVSNQQITHYLKCTGYGFSIPTGATINGITVAVEDWSRRDITDHAVQLVKGGAIQATNYATNTRLPRSDAYTNYGGSTDLWGNTWTAADINSAGFGVAFAAQRGPYNRSDTAYVDHMQISVSYSVTTPVNCTSQASGNWSAATTWTSCRGGIPLAGDTVTIASGDTVTQDVNSPAITALTISGTLNNASSTLTVDGAMTINSGGGYTGGSGAVSITGDLVNSGSFTSGSGTWTFNGSAAQTLTGATAFTKLSVNNAAGVTIGNDVTVATLLTLASGALITGGHTLITSQYCPGSVSRTSGFVSGNLRLRFPVGAVTCTFPVGTGTAYAPITVTPPGGSAGGYLTGSTTGNEHPDIAASGIDSSLDANRYWTLGSAADTIIAGTYAITFNFVAGDVDAAATPGNFVIGQVAGGTWTMPSPVTAASSSTQSNNVVISGSTFNTANSFVVGERKLVCGLPSTLPPGVSSWPAGMSCVCDNFARASLNPSTIYGGNFQVSTSSGSFGLPRIVNSGYLRLTDNTGNVATAVTLPGSFPAAGNLITVEFRNYAYDGTGADGIALTLSDASITPVPGAYGGSLGYAQKNTPSNIPGFAGGWVGIGFDEYGNYSNPTEGRTGGPGLTIDSVAVRGSGSGYAAGQYPYLAGTTTLSPGIDDAASTTPANGDLYRVTVDARGYTWNGTTGNKTTTVSVQRDTTGTGASYSTLVAPFDAFVANTAQEAVPARWALSFTGSTGGSTNIHEIGSLKVCAQTILPPAGYSILVDNLSPTTCPSDPRPTVTVKPLDSNGNVVTNYTNTVTISARLLNGGTPAGTVTWTKLTGGGVFTPSGASATYSYVLADNGVASFSLNDNTQENLYITVSETPGTLSSTLGTPVQFTSGVASFVIDYPDALGTGVVAGRAHLLRITRNKSTCGGGVDTSYTGSKALDGWYTPAAGEHPTGALAPQLCATNAGGTCLPTTGACQTLSIAEPTVDPNSNDMPALNFSSGVAEFCLATSDVGKYTVSLRDDSTATGTPPVIGATSNLTVRPFAVAVRDVTGNPAANTASGSVFTTAGSTFPAVVQGYLWKSTGSGTAGWGDANGDGMPDSGATLAQLGAGGLASHYQDTVVLSADTSQASNFAPTAPPATQGSLSGASVAVTGGSGSTSTLSYSEVGSFTLKATPSSTYLSTPGVDLGPRVAIFAGPSNLRTSWIGRFKPDHFTLSAGTLTNRGAAACAPASSFTYLGEGLDLAFTLTAERLGGGTTANYEGAWAKLDPTAFASFAVGARSGTTDLTSRISGQVTGSPVWAGGVLSNVTLRAAVARAASPDGPWTGTQFGIAPVDSDGTALSALDLDVDGNGSNDHAKVGNTTELRFGTLKLDSAYGSELLPIRVPVRTLYWDGSTWKTNAEDSCTSFDSSIASLANYQAAPSGTALSAGNFSIASNWNSGTLTLGTSPAAAGTADIVFSKPSPTATGSVDLSLDLTGTMPWLLGTWSSVGSAWQQNPVARITFGASRSPFIFLREMY